jgi:hypothetical protein
MIAKNGIEIEVGQFWKCNGWQFTGPIEIVAVRKSPALGRIEDDLVFGYVTRSHKSVTMEADDFLELIENKDLMK